MNDNASKLTRIVSFLFFLSGFSALAYEVIWFKRFSHVWGSSTLSQAAVVSTFLFGLAVGAATLGRLADRVKSPLGWYCLFELLIGIFALIIPYELQWLRWISSSSYSIVEAHPVVQTGFRFLLTFLVIGPPCVLMGGTLPMLMRNFLVSHPWMHETTGWLYAINTLGAAAGCYFTGFHLLPSLGILWTNYVAFFINMDVALIAFLLIRQYKTLEGSDSAIETTGTEPIPISLQPVDSELNSRSLIFPAAALTGCASLILQMVWTRKLAVMLGGTTYVFSAILFVFLLGIGLGSLVYSRTVHRIRSLSRTLTFVILIMLLAIAAGNFAIPHLTMAVATARYLRSNTLLNALISVSASSVLQLIPTICMGFLFPFFVDILRATSQRVGTLVGDLYTWNTAGSIIGTWLAPFVLISLFGTSYAIAVAMSLYVLALLLLYPFSPKRLLFPLAPAALLAGGLIWLTSLPLNPLRTDIGLFLDGYIPAHEVDQMFKPLFFKEGAMANVLVTDLESVRNLRVNGKVDASDGGDMSMQLGLAYFPRFLKPESTDVMVIGYGSGTTTGASLLFPGTQVTCCEIEPAIIEASSLFNHVNLRPERNLNFNLVLDDGRSYLEGSRSQYDLILSEPSNPWMAGISNLFTLEFYREVQKKLKPGGIFTQWIHTYTISSYEYRMIVRTMLEVFPHTALIRISSGDTLLLASDTSLIPDASLIDRAQALVDATPEVQRNMIEYFGTADVRILMLQGYALSQEEIRKLAFDDEATVLNTDLNMWLEFQAPLYIFLPQDLVEDVDLTLVKYTDPQWWIRNFTNWNCGPAQLTALKSWAQLFTGYQMPEHQKPLMEFALQLDPNDPLLLADRLENSTQDPAQFVEILNRLVDISPEFAFQAGLGLLKRKEYAMASEIFEKVVEKKPTFTTAWTHLAQTQAVQKYYNKADAAFDKAKELDPKHPLLEQALSEYEKQKRSRNKSMNPDAKWDPSTQ